MVRRLQQHTGKVVPLLVDENIHCRMTKWMYAAGYGDIAVREHMDQIPLVYGVWHAYRFLCLHLHREFFPVLAYFDQGLAAANQRVHTVQKMPHLERLFGALWVVGGEMLPALDTAIADIQTYMAGVRTRTQSGPLGVLASRAAADDRVRGLYADRLRGAARTRMLARLHTLLQLRLLISDYCPAVFGVGYHVRSCAWEGRKLASSKHAKVVLAWVLILLMRLSPDAAGRLKYVRTVCVALLSWTPWHDVAPGCIFAEEGGEAMLSKVTKALRRHRTGTTHEHYADVFLSVPPAKVADRHAMPMPRKTLDIVRSRFRMLLQRRLNLPMVRWRRDKAAIAPEPTTCITESRICPVMVEMRSWNLEVQLRGALACMVARGSHTIDFHTALVEVFGERNGAAVQLEDTVRQAVHDDHYKAQPRASKRPREEEGGQDGGRRRRLRRGR